MFVYTLRVYFHTNSWRSEWGLVLSVCQPEKDFILKKKSNLTTVCRKRFLIVSEWVNLHNCPIMPELASVNFNLIMHLLKEVAGRNWFTDLNLIRDV